MSTIPLAKGYDPKRIEFPGYLSIKLDGVPVRIDVEVHTGGATHSFYSRQGKPVPSVKSQVDTLVACAMNVFPEGHYTFVVEITHPDFPEFKDCSGVVRRHEQCDKLVLNIFDFNASNPFHTGYPFGDRYEYLRLNYDSLVSGNVKIITQCAVRSQQDFNSGLERLEELFPKAEGFVYRAASAEFKPGTRHWDYMKIVQDPSMDLAIVGVEEAIDKFGRPKGMAGGLIADYKGQRIGIGPGKLTHAERTTLWQNYKSGSMRFRPDYAPSIAKVQYKRDNSYTALRQPTFQCWRDDKDEVSYD